MSCVIYPVTKWHGEGIRGPLVVDREKNMELHIDFHECLSQTWAILMSTCFPMRIPVQSTESSTRLKRKIIDFKDILNFWVIVCFLADVRAGLTPQSLQRLTTFSPNLFPWWKIYVGWCFHFKGLHFHLVMILDMW